MLRLIVFCSCLITLQKSLWAYISVILVWKVGARKLSARSGISKEAIAYVLSLPWSSHVTLSLVHQCTLLHNPLPGVVTLQLAANARNNLGSLYSVVRFSKAA